MGSNFTQVESFTFIKEYFEKVWELLPMKWQTIVSQFTPLATLAYPSKLGPEAWNTFSCHRPKYSLIFGDIYLYEQFKFSGATIIHGCFSQFKEKSRSHCT